MVRRVGVFDAGHEDEAREIGAGVALQRGLGHDDAEAARVVRGLGRRAGGVAAIELRGGWVRREDDDGALSEDCGAAIERGF